MSFVFRRHVKDCESNLAHPGPNNKMEATIVYWKNGNYYIIIGLYRGYIGIMERKMETTILYGSVSAFPTWKLEATPKSLYGVQGRGSTYKSQSRFTTTAPHRDLSRSPSRDWFKLVEKAYLFRHLCELPSPLP